jgi:outer membrane protein assembly factor BamB
MVVVAACLTAAGCTPLHRTAAPATPPAPPERVPPLRSLGGVPAPSARRLPVRHAVLVSVIDGDTREVVPRARVAVGAVSAATNRRGVATVRILRNASLPVHVQAVGYIPLATRVQFSRTPYRGLRIYRRATQWPMYGVTPQRTQAHTTIRLRPPFRIAWARNLGSLVEFPAVIDRGAAYVSNLHGILWALSMTDGSVLWRFDMGHDEQDSSPAVVGDTVVAHSKGGRVFVLDRRTGRMRWSRGASSLVESSPVVVNGIDYFGDWMGDVYALDLGTHRFRWRRSFGAKITSSIAVDGATLYFGDYAGRVWALARRTGEVRWSRRVNGRVYGTPAVAGGRVFVPSSDGGSLTAFSTSGLRLWSLYTGAYVYSSPAVWHGRVYVGSYNGLLYCLSARTGAVLWSIPMGGAVSGAPVVVDGVVYAGSFAHRIVGADARTGRILFRFAHGEYVPLSANGGRALLVGYNRVFAAFPRR